MEPDNRPYVDPDTAPGDAATEDWADDPTGPGDKSGPRPPAQPVGSDQGGVVDGSPADEFINEPGAIDARNDDDGKQV